LRTDKRVTETRAAGATADLTDPIWTVEHIAGCFHIKVVTAREYTYRAFAAPGDSPPTGAGTSGSGPTCSLIHRPPAARRRRESAAAERTHAPAATLTAPAKNPRSYRQRPNTVAQARSGA
jgi:hypothetical protein